MIDLYHFWDSPCCFKVRAVLGEKGLDWTPHLIASVQFDHFQPDYQALNRHAIVPTLIHDGDVLIQSGVIAEYLEDAFPAVRLTPKAPVARARMREWMAEEQAYLFPLIVVMSFNLMMTLRAEAYSMDQLKEWAKRHPDQQRAQGYLRRVTDPIDREAVAAAADKFAWHMGYLDGQMADSGGPWLCGADYSLADLSIGPLFDRIEHLDLMRIVDRTPRVAAWWERMKARPAFMAAAPPDDYRMWGPTKPIPAERVPADAPYGSFPG